LFARKSMRPNPARGFGNLIGRGVGGQIRLDGEAWSLGARGVAAPAAE
jgi:hypothetical protein